MNKVDTKVTLQQSIWKYPDDWSGIPTDNINPIPQLEEVFKEGDKVKVHEYKIHTGSESKVLLRISDIEEKKWHWEDCANVMGNEIGKEVRGRVSDHMSTVFSHPLVIEEILNFRMGREVSMEIWKFNEEFHDNMSKLLKVRHTSQKFGL
jgi:hypothetical protein